MSDTDEQISAIKAQQAEFAKADKLPPHLRHLELPDFELAKRIERLETALKAFDQLIPKLEAHELDIRDLQVKLQTLLEAFRTVPTAADASRAIEPEAGQQRQSPPAQPSPTGDLVPPASANAAT